MSKNIHVLSDNYPIIVVRATGEPSEEEIDAFVVEFDAVLASHQGGFILISDQSKEVIMGAKVRIKLGKSINALSGKYSEREIAVFVVIPSVISRMMMNGIKLIARPNNKLSVAASFSEAMAKAEALQEVKA
ncbi:MAG: hypothetical protein HC896_11905 [Bacteroidales bacterium]|nr:hypothetical protein [Bacteroidales bacterium]